MQTAWDPMDDLEKEEDSDDDFALDGDEEKMHRQIKEMRLNDMKADFAEKQE
jgi:hypothetical protein